MIITDVLGKQQDAPYDAMDIDIVDIEWYEAHKKIQKRVTAGGLEIGIRLEQAHAIRGLCQGDVLAVTGQKAIVVNITESDCIMVKTKDSKMLAKVCYEIGNRHSPLFYGDDDELLMPFDKPIFEMLVKIHAHPVETIAKIHADKSISSYGNHGHGHGHDDHQSQSQSHAQAHAHAHAHDHGDHDHDHPHPHPHHHEA